MARHRDQTYGSLWVLPSLVIPLAIAAVAWTTHVASEGDAIAPNVRFAGVDISGLTPEAAAEQVSDRESEFLATPVVIGVGDRQVIMTAEEIGYVYLHEDTLSALVSARHRDEPWEEFVAWVSAPFAEVRVRDHFAFDEQIARDRLSRDDFIIQDAIEPSLVNSAASGFHVVPGTDGVMVDPDQLVSALREANVADGAIEIEASHTTLQPNVSDEAAEAMALDINDMTGSGVLAVVGHSAATLAPPQIRRHITWSIDHGSLSVSMDMKGLQEEIESMFPDPIGDFVPPELDVVSGVVEVTSMGEAPPVCCSTESVQRAAQTLLNGGATSYRLDPRPQDDPNVLAWADGSLITEPIAEFTTNHACCESRVTNIHTIADALTGKYLLPGETLSINEFVGPRTREKGYVSAGAIRGGHMTDEVGGGVSQFVTTMFNAAFLGGLDLDKYRSHSVYFSRYPFGREATLSIPEPDLVITNSTSNPVLIWPTYDDTSITVTLYSTKAVEVEELEQRVTQRRLCTHSEIDRQRTYSDGRVVVDTIVADYRPADGVDCNGRRIPQP